MKSWYTAVIFLMTVSDLYSSSPLKEAGAQTISQRCKKTVTFGKENILIIPHKKSNPGEGFSYSAAPAKLKKDAQAALAALDEARRPIVLSERNERTSVRPLRDELSDAKARADAPKKIAAAQRACEYLRDQLHVDAVTATRENPVKRSGAFIKKK